MIGLNNEVSNKSIFLRPTNFLEIIQYPLNLINLELYKRKTQLTMKFKLTLLLIVLSFISRAETEKRIAPTFYNYKTDTNPAKLNSNEAIYIFELTNIDPLYRESQIKYSIDGEEATIKLQKGNFEIKTTPGKHIFQIFINSNYYELFSDSLYIAPQSEAYYKVRASYAYIEVIEDKPVIYLYSQTKQEFEVTVEPKNGEFTFTYPAYEENWTGTIFPNGKIEVDGASFRYLFWESTHSTTRLNPEMHEGSVVKSEEVLAFIEGSLDQVGFNASEKADFITYWVPRIQQFDQVFIKFNQDSSCNQFAEMNITPAPDHINRFYMSWGEYNGNVTPVPQVLTPMSRDGFSVLEWGGMEIEVYPTEI